MEFKTQNKVTWLSYIDEPDLIAGVSTRLGGYSNGSFESMNLGLNTLDDKNVIIKNRELFFGTITPQMNVLHLNQIHSNIVCNSDLENFQVYSDGDGLLTTKKNNLLSITIADCGSVLFYDNAHTVICAIHCGWKGTKSGIIQNALQELSKFSDLSEVHAIVGPMIRCSNYEVGKEFLNYFNSEYFKEGNNKIYFDLNQVIITTLLRANLASVTDCGFDTYTESNYFFSHRQSSQSGRMCAFISLK